MDIQKQIEQTVTNGRGYMPKVAGQYDSDAALQSVLASMSEGFTNYGAAIELEELDNDLKNLGYSDAVNTPEKVEQALKVKRYLVGLATRVVQSQKESKDSMFDSLLKNDYSNLDSFISKEEFSEKFEKTSTPKEYFLGGNLSDFLEEILPKEIYKKNNVKVPKRYLIVSEENNEKNPKKH